MKRWNKEIFGAKGLVFAFMWFWVTATAASGAGLVAAWGDNNGGQTTLPPGLGQVKAIAAGDKFSVVLKTDGTVTGWGSFPGGPFFLREDLKDVKAISAAGNHILALKSDGSVQEEWGPSGGQPDQLLHMVVVQVAAGINHSLAIKADGTVIAWGSNTSGQTNVPATLSNVVAVAGGLFHSLALGGNGLVTAWGGNSVGQTNVPSGLSNVIAIAAGDLHSLALKSDGTVVAWGDGADGKCDVPAGLSNVVAIAAGPDRSMALKSDGSVVIWGSNIYHQGVVLPGLSATAICAGRFHNLALVSSGPVQILQHPQNQVVNSTSNAVFSVSVTGDQPMSFQWRYNGANLVDSAYVSGSTNSTLTLKDLIFTDTGSYSVLVSNAFGSVYSLDATLTVISPPLVMSQSSNLTVKAGSDVGLFASVTGSPTLSYQWSFDGTNIAGATGSYQLLTNVQPTSSGVYLLTISNTYGVVQTAPISLMVTDSAPFIVRQPGSRVALPGQSVTLFLDARGSSPLRYQWRFNGEDIAGATNATLTLGPLSYGQSGYYNVEVANSFGEVISAKAFLNVTETGVWGISFQGYTPMTNVPPGMTNLVAVSAGDYHVLGLRSDNTVTMWMNWGPTAQLSGVTNLPAGLSNITAVAAAGNVSLALKSDGRVVAWGVSTSGQTNVPTFLTNAMGIAAGPTHCLAVRSNGTVVAWGTSLYGATSVPQGLSNVVSVAAGTYSSMALRSDGTVVVWGGNAGESHLPAGLSNNVVAIAAGQGTCLALRNDGTIIEWGATPSPPSGLSNVVSIAASGLLSIALKNDGTAVTWSSSGVVAAPAPTNVFAIAANGAVYVALVGDGRPVMKVQPFSRSIVKGSKVQLAGFAVGKQPMSYQWLHEGEIIDGATNALLTLTNVQGKDTGGYQLIVSNALGKTNSTTAVLSMPVPSSLGAAVNSTNVFFSPDRYTTNAWSWFPQVRVSYDGDGAAQSGAITNNQQSVMATYLVGPGELKFMWKVSSEEGFDFLKVSMDSNTSLAAISGEVGWEQKSITIPAGQHFITWTYFKDGSVSDGEDAGWVDQAVYTPVPVVVTQQPVSQSVPQGGSVTFSVQATGGGVLTYQWLKGGTNLLGATGTSLSFTNVSFMDAGVYAVRVSNGAMSVLSTYAALTLADPPVLGSPSVTQDGSIVLASRLSNGGAMTTDVASGFELQASDDLITWVALTNSPVVTNGAIQFVEPNCTNHAKRFYRVVERR